MQSERGIVPFVPPDLNFLCARTPAHTRTRIGLKKVAQMAQGPFWGRLPWYSNKKARAISENRNDTGFSAGRQKRAFMQVRAGFTVVPYFGQIWHNRLRTGGLAPDGATFRVTAHLLINGDLVELLVVARCVKRALRRHPSAVTAKLSSCSASGTKR